MSSELSNRVKQYSIIHTWSIARYLTCFPPRNCPTGMEWDDVSPRAAVWPGTLIISEIQPCDEFRTKHAPLSPVTSTS